MMPHIESFLLQPLRQLNFRDRIRDTLKNGRNANHLLNLSGQPLEIVIPIEDITNVNLSLH